MLTRYRALRRLHVSRVHALLWVCDPADVAFVVLIAALILIA